MIVGNKFLPLRLRVLSKMQVVGTEGLQWTSHSRTSPRGKSKRIFQNLLPSNKSADYGWGKLHKKIIKTGFKKVFIGYRIFSIKHVFWPAVFIYMYYYSYR